MAGDPRFYEVQRDGFFTRSPTPKWEEDFSLVYARLDELHAAGVTDWEYYFRTNPAEVTYCAGSIRIVAINQAGSNLFQAENRQSVTHNLVEHFTSNSWEEFENRLISLARGELNFSSETEMLTCQGERKHLLLYAEVVPDSFKALESVVVSFIDITERKRIEGRNKLGTHLSKIISGGASIKEALNAIALGAEEECRMCCAVMLLDHKTGHLTTAAAPELPDFYNAGIDALKIVAEGELTGASVFGGHRLIVEDIQSSPAWDRMHSTAARAGLQSCWSEPIRDSAGELLGVLVFYNPPVKAPDASSVEAIQYYSALLGRVLEQHHAQQELHFATLLYQTIGKAVLVTDAGGVIVAMNSGFSRLTGYDQDEVVGRNVQIFSSERANAISYSCIWEVLQSRGQWQGEIWTRCRNGDEYPGRLSINYVYDPKGKVSKCIALISDINAQEQLKESIWHHPEVDTSASLPSRQRFRDYLDQELKKAERAGLGVGLLGIDLDKFKEINETLGHNMGDLVLLEAARRIASCLRDSDTVARLGGDEFAVVLTARPDVRRVTQIAGAINQKISEPFHLGDEVVYISASIGITFYPTDGPDADSLIKNAEQSMYVAKNEGRNRYSFYTSSLQDAAQARRALLNDMRGALAADQFKVYFQPIVDLNDGRIFKAEALLRWQHPMLGIIGPMEFIQLAEETGLINEIGDWVFRRAADCAKYWNEVYTDGIQVSINKSPVQFRNACNAAGWIKYLSDIGLSGNHIVIEITESVLLDSSPYILDQLAQYRKAGIQISIDDFGTGYSSLSYLKKFAADYLKIDRSFIIDMAKDNHDMALSEAIIAMAHKLGITVIAEGVETAEQRGLLVDAQCNFGQGYHFSEAVTAEQFEFLLDNKRYPNYSLFVP